MHRSEFRRHDSSSGTRSQKRPIASVLQHSLIQLNNLLNFHTVAIGATHRRLNAQAKSRARDAGELAMQLNVAMLTVIVRFGLTKGAAQYLLSSRLNTEEFRILT